MGCAALHSAKRGSYVSLSLLTRKYISSYLCHFSVFIRPSLLVLLLQMTYKPFFCFRREILQESAKELVDSICVYRAGYIAEVVMSLIVHCVLSFG
jgi:hypothetical protein